MGIQRIVFAVVLAMAAISPIVVLANSPPKVRLYDIYEITMAGPSCMATDSPARDVELRCVWRKAKSGKSIQVHGFFDGDGHGGIEGNVFKIRFCPTAVGVWKLAETASDRPELNDRMEGHSIVCEPSDNKGFWLANTQTQGRWYVRSDGSHPYILGNTMYSFLSERNDKGPGEGNIAADVAANAEYFKKIRFSITGDRYPHPNVKPFLDDRGEPTDDGNYSHRPNPQWFHERVDPAVQTALEHDLIADLILNGPDTRESRSILAAGASNGGNTPFLRYIAARYGAYPNVWICVSNEFGIKQPKYTPKQIAEIGARMRRFLPYPTPMSVHSAPRNWHTELNTTPPWHDHVILQKKIKKLPVVADLVAANYSIGEHRPVIDDELAYEGDGDGWSEADVIESHTGAFLGGGYGTTGHKPASKRGHYFFGNFKASEHKAADNLKWLRERIDRDVCFWHMHPGGKPRGGRPLVFRGVADSFRAMGCAARQYVLGTKAAKSGVRAELGEGRWRVVRYDVMRKRQKELAANASGMFVFDTPASRAALFVFTRLAE